MAKGKKRNTVKNLPSKEVDPKKAALVRAGGTGTAVKTSSEQAYSDRVTNESSG